MVIKKLNQTEILEFLPLVWNAMLENNLNKELTVHSSLYAVPIYEKLGFIKIDDTQTEDGITYRLMMCTR